MFNTRTRISNCSDVRNDPLFNNLLTSSGTNTLIVELALSERVTAGKYFLASKTLKLNSASKNLFKASTSRSILVDLCNDPERGMEKVDGSGLESKGTLLLIKERNNKDEQIDSLIDKQSVTDVCYRFTHEH